MISAASATSVAMTLRRRRLRVSPPGIAAGSTIAQIGPTVSITNGLRIAR